MFRKIEDFTKAWEQESAATQKLMNELTDTSLSQKVAEGHRTLGRIAWHIVTATPEMMGRTGLQVGSVSGEAPMPQYASEIQKGYAAVSSDVMEQVKANWTDQTLTILDDMYGEKWPRGLTLKILIDHQTHHRGQMTVLMRQAGLKVPGVYGPSKEEWGAYGGNPPEI
jgi:uncharacterized damage-inducible protein DinB